MKSKDIQELGGHMTEMFTAIAADMAKRDAERERVRQEAHALDVALMKSVKSSQDAFFRQMEEEMSKLSEKIDEYQRDLDISIEQLKKALEGKYGGNEHENE